ncbi:arylsulfatase [Aliifodinibius sp. S!AR15-10]|uniref:arylsulfatase n=1 Tax=Aliifodinibius sp. S!AR15-10 TaxID=2950437 RepID=UPI0028560163|nr:arylsulfatase [Aliifodinibius sp. S!AR15-10]MDR8394556.1 arylsulfatase [Aliifodinibius sp. S!AR15-10]
MKLLFQFIACWILILIAAGQVLGWSGSQMPQDQKPNVIVIITDDQGYGDLGFHGNPIIQTPYMDKFFEESVEATNFHVSPTCTPTRGALMTGRYTNRVGTWHTIGGRSLLFEDETILPQIFAQNGYATGMFGKWHLGDNYPFRPGDRGFQQVVRHGGGGVTQAPDYWGNDYFDDTYWFNGEPRETEGYVTDVFFEESLKFIEENRERPFFAYISTNAPHAPFHVPEEYYNLYKGEDQLLERQKRFYGMITNIDDNLGRLEQKLQELKLAENTIVIYMTDNGTAAGFSQREGKDYGYNADLRGTKGSEYEGGHRVPFAIRWPDAGIEGGKELPHLLAHIDVLPTLADLAGLTYVETKELDGRSFAPLLHDEDATWDSRTLIVDSQRTENLVKWRRSAVMDDTWRLINGQELYHIKDDISQHNDVASEHPEVVNRLRESYNKWWTSLAEQGVNERYAYIKAGTRYENPVRLSSHDMHIYPYKYVWHQNGVLEGVRGKGKLKIEIADEGTYRISLRRYPRESGLAFNEQVAARKESVEISNPMPASQQHNLTHASLYIAGISETKPIPSDNAEAVHFEGYIPAGKYDVTAFLEDEQGRVYPSYYTYIERISD